MSNTDRRSVENKDLYTRLIKYPKMFGSLVFLMFIVGLVFTSMIFSNILLDLNWITPVIPIATVGLLLMLFPKTEEWEYKAWQSEKEKREQTFYD